MKNLSSESANQAFVRVKKNIGKKKKKNTILGFLSIALGISTVLCGYSYYQYSVKTVAEEKTVKEKLIVEQKTSTLEKGKTIEEPKVKEKPIPMQIENDLNVTIRDILWQEGSKIQIVTEINTKTSVYDGKSYSLVRDKDLCRFEYYNVQTTESISCDYVIGKYSELEEILVKEPLQEYEIKADENGKIVYPVERVMVIVTTKEGKGYSLQAPENVNEIMVYVENMLEKAR